MTESDNVFMKTTFAVMNRILKAIDSQMDNDVFNAEVFTAENFGITENRFARILKMLSDSGYITGLKIIDNGEPDVFDTKDYKRFEIIINEVSLTFKGMQFLAENTMTAKAFTLLKKLHDITPV